MQDPTSGELILASERRGTLGLSSGAIACHFPGHEPLAELTDGD